MTTVLPLTMGTIALSDLRLLLGCSERELQRKLRAQRIPPTGRRVPLATLRSNWPLVFNSILILQDPKMACPHCGMPTARACVSCDFVAA